MFCNNLETALWDLKWNLQKIGKKEVPFAGGNSQLVTINPKFFTLNISQKEKKRTNRNNNKQRHTIHCRKARGDQICASELASIYI